MKFTEDDFDLVLDFLGEEFDALIDRNEYMVLGGSKDREDAGAEEWVMETAIEMIRYMKANKDFI